MSDQTTAGVDELPAHLRTEHGDLFCKECGCHITIDPNTGREYGHARKNYERLPETRGRCPRRPNGVDPHGEFARPKADERRVA